MASDIHLFFGVSRNTAQGKARRIQESLNIHPFSLQWTLPSRADSNPLLWMLEINGVTVDIRHLPVDVQEIAHQKGLIPYVPGAKRS